MKNRQKKKPNIKNTPASPVKDPTPITTLQDLVHLFEKRDSTALETAGLKYTYEELFHIITGLAKGFLSMGLSVGDRVMLISRNRPQWVLICLAITYAGLVDVPRGEKASDTEINYIIKHSNPRLIIAEDEKIYSRIKDEWAGSNKIIISIDKVEGIDDIWQVLKKGESWKKSVPTVTPHMVASHLYTSGTTGEPKGAELTHGNYISNLLATCRKIEILPTDINLSILPLWHAFARMVEYLFLFRGGCIYYSSIASFGSDLTKVKPTCLVLVPRILETIFDNKIMKKLEEKTKTEKTLFKWMVNQSAEFRKPGFNPFRFLQKIPGDYLEKTVFSKLKESLGGRIRLLISGGGKLRGDIDHFFFSAGLPIIEGYGLTETSPVISARTFEDYTLGTVGSPLDNLSVMILDPETGRELKQGKTGVLFVKGPSVMKGYYKNAYETGKVMNNRWFDTGDLAYIDKKGNLVITGRQKNIIVLSNGENISPEYIEETLKKSPLITNIVILGQDWKGLGALVEPNIDTLEKLCPGGSNNLKSAEVQKIFKRQIRDYVNPLTGFREYECIKAFRLIDKPFQMGRELTETIINPHSPFLRLVLPPHGFYSCSCCGRCCNIKPTFSTWDGFAKIRQCKTYTEVQQELQGMEPMKFNPKEGMIYIQNSRGRCVFLDHEGLCRIHKEQGSEIKPLGCRLYPFRLISTPQGIYAGLSWACPSVLNNQGEPLEEYIPHLQSIIKEKAMEGDINPNRRIYLNEDIFTSWKGYQVIEEFLLSCLNWEDLHYGLWKSLMILSLLTISQTEKEIKREGIKEREIKSEEIREFLSSPLSVPFPLDEDYREFERFFAMGILSLMESREEVEVQKNTQILLKGGNLFSVSLGRSINTEELEKYRQQGDRREGDEKLRGYIKSLIDSKSLLLKENLLTPLAGLNLLFPVFDWYYNAFSMSEDRDKPSMEDINNSIIKVEQAFNFHYNSLVKPFARLFFENIYNELKRT